MQIAFGGDSQRFFQNASGQVQSDAAPTLKFLSSGFTITDFREHQPRIWVALIKPNQQIAQSFTLENEYLVIGHGFPKDFQLRTLLAEPRQEIEYRVDSRVRFVVSSAPTMKAACAAWANQKRIAVVPIDPSNDFTADSGLQRLTEILSESLWKRDVFDDPEPVSNPAEFYGREQIVQQLVTKTYLGQLSSVFGLRKIGKTSLVRRVRDLLVSDESAVNVPTLVQCNATRIKAGQWHVVLRDLVESWAEVVNSKSLSLGLQITVRPSKLSTLISDNRPAASDAAIADAFQKDFVKILKGARSIAKASEASQVRLIALFDEADEIYPHREDSGHWKEDYFLLWNTLQTIKRGWEDPSELVYILVGVNPSGVEAGSLLNRPNPLFELSKQYLQPLSRAEAAELMRGLGARVGLSFQDDAIDEIYSITGGHPWLLRKLGSSIHQTEGSSAIRLLVSSDMIHRVFERTKRSFYGYIDWILSHLKEVAPDEHKLLKDLAIGGKDRYLAEWADISFRDTFAEHLAKYGVVEFHDDVPSITVGLIRDCLASAPASSFSEQKSQLRDAGDTLEGMIRARIVSDLKRNRTREEAVDFIVKSIPGDAKNRPKARAELNELGLSAGLQALIESLNWGDYVCILRQPESGVVWAGPDVDLGKRTDVIQDAIQLIHLARHNNDAELRDEISRSGFDAIWQKIKQVRDMLSE